MFRWRAKEYHARRKRRVHRRTHWKASEVAAAFEVPEYIIRYMIRNNQIPFERLGGRIWLTSESINAVVARGHHLKL